MSVGTFDPNQPNASSAVTHETLTQFLAAAADLDAADFGLDEVAVARLALFASTDGADWGACAKTLDSRQLTALIRLFALAETRLPSWEAGAKSPVVPLARELKARGEYPEDLTPWIKSNSRNRFLPYGSLMDRL